ncbi:MAG: family 78 glycoside hydrolase catalytic domain [Kiritimatiellae bacterium]|nr:family 78 glycoside hydrolase catalytic domain [Kiritimatiellia bacterium]
MKVWLLAAFSVIVGSARSYARLATYDLRCEYLREPLAVHEPAPRLYWKLASADNGARQTAYRVLVASSLEALEAGNADLWDSGKVESDECAHIEYGGVPLESKMDCYWKVCVWDGGGSASSWSEAAHWRMGLLAPDDWRGAKWIGVGGGKPEDFTPHNGFHSALNQPAPQWVAVDLGETVQFDEIKIYPTCPYDYAPMTPGYLFPLRYRLEVANMDDFSDARTVFDGTGSDQPNPRTRAVSHYFDTAGARYVRVVVTKFDSESHGWEAFTVAELEVIAAGRVVSRGCQAIASSSIDAGAWQNAFLTDGRLLPYDGNATVSAPAASAGRFRKQFTLGSAPSSAHIAVTGLGTYELYANGVKVGDSYLAPEWTSYQKRVFYRVYDIAPLLKAGDNVLSAEVAPGWYGSPLLFCNGVAGWRNVFRAVLETDDGTLVKTDSSWETSGDGPVTRAELYYGEDYDGTREQPGWDLAGFDSAGWQAAEEIDEPADLGSSVLVGQNVEPVKCEERIDAKSVHTADYQGGILHVFDFGQNIAGGFRLHADLPAGTRLVVGFGEMLEADGTVYRGNLRGAMEVFNIVWPGGERTVETKHTYFGYRYAQVSGLVNPSADDATALVMFSASPETGMVESSNEFVEKLFHCINWNQRGNMVSTATDCPQRDERLGWCADFYEFSWTAMMNRDLAAFACKWEQSMIDDQLDDGRFPVYAPCENTVNQHAAPGWADVGLLMPWRIYEMYGDRRQLERSYDACARWLEYVRANNPDGIWRNARGNDFGEWLNGDTLILDGYPTGNNEMSKEMFATAFHYLSAATLAKIAQTLGKDGDAAAYGEYARYVRDAYRSAYVGAGGILSQETQAGYAITLNFGLADAGETAAMTERLVSLIDYYNGHLSTGIHATHRAMLELSQNGHHDLANEIFNLKTVPSWGYMIENGATTLWERWDGYVAGRGYQNPSMNSFNHWVFGSVGEWVWKKLVGLDSDAPGWKHAVVRPMPDPRTARIAGSYDSIRGRYSVVSDWDPASGTYSLDVTIPPSCGATVFVPGESEPRELEAGTYHFESLYSEN